MKSCLAELNWTPRGHTKKHPEAPGASKVVGLYLQSSSHICLKMSTAKKGSCLD